MNTSPFQETLSACLTNAANQFEDSGVVFTQPEIFKAFQYGGMGYKETKTASEEIETIKGKKTKKMAHLTIWRDETGRYEWNAYIL